MRTLLLISCLVLQCGDDPDPVPPIGAVADPPIVPASDPVSPDPVEAPLALACEGLVRTCGGWEGCILVRPRAEDATRFDGVGERAGHLYVRDESCLEGVCNDMCDPATGTCVHGLREEVPTVCSRATGPSRAPFYCELVDGACVQHDLPPAAVSAGPRS